MAVFVNFLKVRAQYPTHKTVTIHKYKVRVRAALKWKYPLFLTPSAKRPNGFKYGTRPPRVVPYWIDPMAANLSVVRKTKKRRRQ